MLILGAGASKPYGYPVGSELRDDIRRWLAKDTCRNYAALRDGGFGSGEIRDLHDVLMYGGFSSVDSAAAKYPELIGIAKSAIAIDLSSRERAINAFDAPSSKGTWYHLLADHVAEERESSISLAVVTFNYERSLEKYLFQLLVKGRKLSEQVARSRLQRLPIVHVHGFLGDPLDIDDNGSCPNRSSKSNAEWIQILPEVQEGSPLFEDAQNKIRDASELWILGCSIHRQNFQRLGLLGTHGEPTEQWLTRRTRVTHKGTSMRDWRRNNWLLVREGEVEHRSCDVARMMAKTAWYSARR